MNRLLPGFLAVAVARRPNTRRYLRGLQMVAPVEPQYAVESARWRREHGFAETESNATSATQESPSQGRALIDTTHSLTTPS